MTIVYGITLMTSLNFSQPLMGIKVAGQSNSSVSFYVKAGCLAFL